MARSLSVVVPVKDEAESLPILVERIGAVALRTGLPLAEIVIVDDGSGDGTWQAVEALAAQDAPAVHAIRLRRNFGKSTALTVGVNAAIGDVIVTMDGDLQDDPEELPHFLAAIDGGADLVSGWKNLFFSPHRYRDDPAHSASWNRGAYLANGLTHCVACHSPLNPFGAVEDDMRFTGNPSGGAGGKAPPLSEPNLLQGGYTRDSLVLLLKTGVTPARGKVGDEMGLVVTEETSHWRDEDLQAVADYLLDAECLGSRCARQRH